MPARSLTDTDAIEAALRYHDGSSVKTIQGDIRFRHAHEETLKKYIRKGYFLITGKTQEPYKRDPTLRRTYNESAGD